MFLSYGSGLQKTKRAAGTVVWMVAIALCSFYAGYLLGLYLGKGSTLP